MELRPRPYALDVGLTSIDDIDTVAVPTLPVGPSRLLPPGQRFASRLRRMLGQPGLDDYLDQAFDHAFSGDAHGAGDTDDNDVTEGKSARARMRARRRAAARAYASEQGFAAGLQDACGDLGVLLAASSAPPQPDSPSHIRSTANLTAPSKTDATDATTDTATRDAESPARRRERRALHVLELTASLRLELQTYRGLIVPG